MDGKIMSKMKNSGIHNNRSYSGKSNAGRGEKYISLFYGGLLLLFTGVIYSWSIFVAPLELEFGWDRSQTSVVFVLSMAGYNMGSMISGVIICRYSHRITLSISAVLLLLGFLGASRLDSLMEIYVFYGVICGLGIGIAYNTVVSTVLTWFPDDTGTVSGLLLAGYGISSFLLGPVINWMLYEGAGWRDTFDIMGWMFCGLILGACVIIRKPPAAQWIAKDSEGEGKEISPGQMLRRQSFYLFFGWLICIGSIGLGVIGSGAVLPLDMGVNSAEAAWIAGVLSVGNAIGRLLYGRLCDRKGRSFGMGTAAVSAGIASLGLLSAQLLGNSVVLTGAYLFIGLAYGSLPVLITYFCTRQYGTRYRSINLGILNANGMVTSVLGSWGSGALYERTGSYTAAFCVMIGISILALVLWKMVNQELKKENRYGTDKDTVRWKKEDGVSGWNDI
ncbi:MFS transporter [Diplocloster modestus]|uniref:MFS transporter n=1 Tax=Diplocloster modestus TaxID=2850322 RepID=A0ABS6K8G3_9FIRM|nr:MFS transporter [Diplocloster modestus]MBU9726792.1 MFS transporter [Diplocloster modestus]